MTCKGGRMERFSVNGCIGEGAYGSADFPEASHLLSHMDYLGIDRCLVWHRQALDFNPVYGNRKLLAEISVKNEYSKRLLPAFVITPSNFYEYGAISFLRESFEKFNLRALRIFPGTSRFEMRTIERVLGAVSDYRPVVLWSVRDSNGPADFAGFVELAGKFPGIKFVLTEAMWGAFNNCVDAMWRADNIYIETSWLHMRDAIEFLRDEFGLERVLFGMGFKSHYGASIAALEHAKITENERNLIYCGNIGKMLGMETAGGKLVKEPPILAGKPLWKDFSRGLPLKNIEVIDAHTHTGPSTRGWIVRDIDMEENVSNMVKQMDECRVSLSVVAPESGLFGEPISSNLEIEEIMRRYPGRFNGYLAFNPLYGERLLPMLDSFFSRKLFIGFKILASYWRIPLTDEGYIPVWEYADKKRMPILIHTWGGSFDSPRMLEDIAYHYKEAVFILGHSGGSGGREEAVELAAANWNVYLEFCGSFTTQADWLDAIRRAGIKKVVFGSDAGGHNLAWELGRFLSIPLPDRELAPALADNFKKIMKGIKI